MVQIAQPQLEILRNYGSRVQQAQVEAPGQWQTWWWICVAGQVVFLPFIFLMAGRWSPRRAREDAEAHQRAVDRELQALGEEPAR